MFYTLARLLGGIALRWFYRDVAVVGLERIPREGPVLLAVNHWNQLVDALLALWLVPRRVTITAKATLFTNPVVGFVLRRVGIVPLRRARDEEAMGRDPARTRDRHEAAFAAVTATLRRGGAVLVFPEGTSHSLPGLLPLRSGLARMAFTAREHGVRGLTIVPIGITFEDKAQPRTRVLVQVGQPLLLDAWTPSSGIAPVPALTAEVERRLRAVTLNFPSAETLDRVLEVSHLLADVVASGGAADGETPLSAVLRVVARVELARQRLEAARDAGAAAVPDEPAAVAPPTTVVRDARRAERLDPAGFLDRLDAFRAELRRLGIAPRDVAIPTGRRDTMRLAARDLLPMAALFPLAVFGALTHRIPWRIAWAVGRGTSRAPEDPAQRTMLAGAVLVLAAYAAEVALVWRLAGPLWALATLVLLPLSATAELSVRDRLRQARRRRHASRLFRRSPATQAALLRTLRRLRREALVLDRRLTMVGSGAANRDR